MQQKTTLTNDQEKTIIHKLRSLPPDKVAQVLDFVDFISQKNRDRRLLKAANKLTEDAFRKIWENPEDEAYDRL